MPARFEPSRRAREFACQRDEAWRLRHNHAMSATTRWSMILATRGQGSDARDALAELCVAYRPVLLAYFRRHGEAQRAEDETQAFFLHFLQQRLAERAEPERGSFRAFLFTAAENHRRERLRSELTAKRGGGIRHDSEAPQDLSDGSTDLARQFDRDWALHVLERACARLQREAAAAGKQALFAMLQEFLSEAPEPGDYERIGKHLAMPPNSVAVAVKRLRERLRTQLRHELADSLGPQASVEAELAWLKQALRSD